MDKIKTGSGPPADRAPRGPKNRPKVMPEAKDEEEEEEPQPEMTHEEYLARRRAFPDLFRFLDEFDTGGPLQSENGQQMEMQMQRQEERKVKSKLAQFADELQEEDEERWDESVQFEDDASLAETPQPTLNMSPEEHDAMSYMNDFARRVQSGDETDETDPMVLLFKHLDKENELMRIQHEHVSNMPEYIGYEEEFDIEEARIRKEWNEDPRSVTAEHAQELFTKIENMRQALWEKYTDKAADRFVVENFDALMLDALKEEDEEESEEDIRAKVLRAPLARLLDPTRPRN